MPVRMRGWLGLLAALLMLDCCPAQAANNPNPNHIDFGIQFNMQTGEPDFKDGFGVWLGYRLLSADEFSFGVKTGYHTFKIEPQGNNTTDTGSSIPVLATGQFERIVGNQLRVFGQLGVGVSINQVSGDLADQIDLKIDPSFLVDVVGGVMYDISPQMSLGAVIDWYITTAKLKANVALGDDTLDIGHVGVGLQFTGRS